MLLLRRSTLEGNLTVQLSTCWRIWWGKRSLAKNRKISSGLVKIYLNETENSQQIIQKIQGKTMLQLSRGNTGDATFPQSIEIWIVKKVKTHLASEEILTQLKRKNQITNYHRC